MVRSSVLVVVVADELPTTATAVVALGLLIVWACKGLGVFVRLDDRLGRRTTGESPAAPTDRGLSGQLASTPWTRDRFNSLVPRVGGFDDLERREAHTVVVSNKYHISLAVNIEWVGITIAEAYQMEQI